MAFNNEQVCHNDRHSGGHTGLKAQKWEGKLAMEVEAGGGSIWYSKKTEAGAEMQKQLE